MRNAFKLVLTLALLCGVAAGVSACGGSDDSGTGGQSGASDRPSELSGTVKVWDFEYEALPEYTEAIDQLDAEFEKLNPGVTVQREAQPAETYDALVRAAFISGQGPDVMSMQPGAVGVLSHKNGLEVLNDQLSPEFQEDVTQWESVTPGYKADGERYGVPIGLNGYVFYYNKKLFAKAGLPKEFEPESWAEVREAGEELEAAGIQAFVGGNKEGYENSWWFGAGFHTENTPEQATEFGEEEIAYTDEPVARAYNPQFEMEEAGLYSENRFSTSFLEGYADFAEGEGGMILGFMNALGFWGEFNPKLGEENVGYFFPPGTPTIPTFATFAFSITKFAKNKDAAIALLEFEMSKKGMEVLDEVGGYMPNRVDVSLPADAPVQAREMASAAQEREVLLAPNIMVPATVTFGPMSTEVSQALQGRISLEDAQQAMQEAAEKAGSG